MGTHSPSLITVVSRRWEGLAGAAPQYGRSRLALSKPGDLPRACRELGQCGRLPLSAPSCVQTCTQGDSRAYSSSMAWM